MSSAAADSPGSRFPLALSPPCSPKACAKAHSVLRKRCCLFVKIVILDKTILKMPRPTFSFRSLAKSGTFMMSNTSCGEMTPSSACCSAFFSHFSRVPEPLASTAWRSVTAADFTPATCCSVLVSTCRRRTTSPGKASLRGLASRSSSLFSFLPPPARKLPPPKSSMRPTMEERARRWSNNSKPRFSVVAATSLPYAPLRLRSAPEKTGHASRT
mmetsp:Transcript_74654/g.207529  ORF Transcript_74654/g.207529 Transcript_74654/m.207529 type:complete len:214 (+) Transcript_74654:785-1426(+)